MPQFLIFKKAKPGSRRKITQFIPRSCPTFGAKSPASDKRDPGSVSGYYK